MSLNPSGLCQCECGEPAPLSPYTCRAKGYVKGEPRRFITGHNGAHRPFELLENRYEVRDCGYETPCWVWLRSSTRKGYGRMWSPAASRLVSAHRYYYEHFIGLIPSGLQIDHLCRNRACVNPQHMEPVTQHVNQQRGTNAKLTRQLADEIRRRGQTGASGKQLAREFGVSDTVIYGIIHGRLWP